MTPSDASEREAGHTGRGSRADGHRVPKGWIWLPEEWRGDAEGWGVGQQGGSSWGHTGRRDFLEGKELKTVPINPSIRAHSWTDKCFQLKPNYCRTVFHRLIMNVCIYAFVNS